MQENYEGRTTVIFEKRGTESENKNKGKGNGTGLAWESQSHCFADEFVITLAHSLGTDTQHDYSQRHCRTMSTIIIKLEERVVYCKL